MTTTNPYPNLFSPITIGPVQLRNRIVSTGHHTNLASGHPTDDLIAYQRARAQGGVGLIVTEVIAVHETAMFSHVMLDALDAACVAPYQRLAEACHQHGAKVFAQLFHPGREIISTADGFQPTAYAPSAVPNERFHIMPQAMSRALIRDVVAGYARTAGYLRDAGYDGVEIVASHGYLPAQFLNPRVNLRDDEYGGDAERRLRFVRDVIEAVRAATATLAVGLRISGDELNPDGLNGQEAADTCAVLSPDVDYFSVVAGSSATLGGSVHIAAPMGQAHGYVAPYAGTVRSRVNKPVIATGRINQPQIAEQIISRGEADLCGMTRALICDPLMPAKAEQGRSRDIRACIACNQSCIGRSHKGVGISCLQHPVSGRELRFGSPRPACPVKQVMVVGAGPAGMKAAATAAERGHQVTLYERDRQLGGQALLALRLPGRDEFGGIITNFTRELEQSGAEVITGVQVDRALVEAKAPDTVILATGATPYLPALTGLDEAHVVSAWQVLRDEVNVGASVVIADWRSDWIGLGLAERLALAGSSVTLCVNAAMVGEVLQLYTRNHYLARLHRLGVRIKTHARLFGADNDTVYFQDTLTDEAMVLDNTDTLVLALGHQAEVGLVDDLEGLNLELLTIGDCVAPRSAEEAVYEGLVAGQKI